MNEPGPTSPHAAAHRGHDLGHDLGRAAHERRARIGLAQVCLAGVLWGTGGLGVQVIRDAAPLSVVTISAWRMVIAAVVLLGVLALTRQLRTAATLLGSNPAQVATVGICTAAYQALYFGSVVAVGVTVATVVSLGFAPVLVTVVESVRERSVPSPVELGVLALALGGLALVSVSADASAGGDHPVLGVLAALGSGTAYALTTLVGRSLARSARPLALTAASTTIGALALLPAAAFTGTGGRDLVEPTVAATLVYLGVMTMALAYGLLYAGLRTTPGSAAVVATLLEPVTAAVLAALLLGERVGPAGLAGVALILLAVAGLGRREAPPA
jgi:DME family drug/metabolite transporter